MINPVFVIGVYPEELRRLFDRNITLVKHPTDTCRFEEVPLMSLTCLQPVNPPLLWRRVFIWLDFLHPTSPVLDDSFCPGKTNLEVLIVRRPAATSFMLVPKFPRSA